MLHVHRSERNDQLLAALRETLASPPADTFAPELIAVPTKGVERWLTQQLSLGLGTSGGERRDGVAANIEFPSPGRLVDRVLAAVTGVDPDEDPWVPQRAMWPLLEVVDAHLDAPWLRALCTYLEHEERRLTTVRHLARLFDRYALHRPEEVRRWLTGDDTGVRSDERWQLELLRRLHEHVGAPSPAERLPEACRRLVEKPQAIDLDLPERLAVFGLTRLPRARLDVLAALAHHRDVHLHVLHPSPDLWARVDASSSAERRRRHDPTGSLPRNPLLASWGQDARELQLVLADAACLRADHHHAVADPPATLLGRLQADVRADRPPPDERAPHDPADRSVEVHACHGRGRQVEVLRDAILHLLDDDPELEPRDVLVMCPDIEAFAPLVHATFGGPDLTTDDDAGDDAAPALRVRLADRSLRQTNPVLAVVARLLDLADARVTASQVLDLADREPVRRRFRLGDDDLARMEQWVATSGIRWGLDAEHRAPFGLDALDHGTWRRGLDRLLVGTAMTEDGARLVHGVLPLDDVGSSDIDLVGRLAELVDRLRTTLDACAEAQPLDAWARVLGDAASALTACAPQDAWQRTELDTLLADVVGEAAGSTVPLRLSELRDLLADRLKGRPTRANFRTGHITVCTLHPMRAVPHRVVCLLGLDDGTFPRAAPRDGDDLLLAEPHVGDRDGRLEDRQMLLDALLSATDKLVITYTGRDERTNQRRPPAVPVGELLEVIEHTVDLGGDPFVREHRLQPFDPENFDADEPWSHDGHALEGARALLAPRVPVRAFLTAPLPPPAEPAVELATLVRFVEKPVRTFLRQRLGIGVGSGDVAPDDRLPVELDHLERWQVGDRLVDLRLAGVDRKAALHAEAARGGLPPGRLGRREVIEEVDPAVSAIVACSLQEAPGDGTSADVRVTLRDGRVLSGTVAGIVGDTLRFATYSRLDPKHRLAVWVRFLALSAARPEGRWRALAVGKARGDAWRAQVSIARLPPIDAQSALDSLHRLVDLLDEGLREPLPIACRTSAAYAAAVRAGRNGEAAARKCWESRFRFDGEDVEPEHTLVFGGAIAFDELASPRFEALARRLWDDLLEHETLEDRA